MTDAGYLLKEDGFKKMYESARKPLTAIRKNMRCKKTLPEKTKESYNSTGKEKNIKIHIEYWVKGQLIEVVSDCMNHKEKWSNNVLQEIIIDKD